MPTVLTRRWWIRTMAINGIVALLVFGAIQLVPVRRSNPPVEREPAWDSPETRALAAQACFNCHSNETQWPWYARVAPVSWVILYDVTEGREKLNFSEWDKYVEVIDPGDPFPPKSLSERVAEQIRSGRMPPGIYLLMHPEARLSGSDKEALIEGLQHTLEQSQ